MCCNFSYLFVNDQYASSSHLSRWFINSAVLWSVALVFRLLLNQDKTGQCFFSKPKPNLFIYIPKAQLNWNTAFANLLFVLIIMFFFLCLSPYFEVFLRHNLSWRKTSLSSGFFCEHNSVKSIKWYISNHLMWCLCICCFTYL